jgi:NAD(P)-dependent dehydrogenase (short-subunit alcohol dehydrogenase family)
VIDDFGGLDVLINNGAVLPQHTRPPWQSEAGEFARVLATNLSAPFEASTAAIAWMQAQGRPGRIVNISSAVADAAREPRGGLAAYGISKVALEGMARFLARETQALGITIATLRPPTTDTDMIKTHVPWDSRPLMPRPDAAAQLYLWAATAPAHEIEARLREP